MHTYIKCPGERKRNSIVVRHTRLETTNLEERRYDAPSTLCTHPGAVSESNGVISRSKLEPDVVFKGETGALDVKELVAKH